MRVTLDVFDPKLVMYAASLVPTVLADVAERRAAAPTWTGVGSGWVNEPRKVASHYRLAPTGNITIAVRPLAHYCHDQ